MNAARFIARAVLALLVIHSASVADAGSRASAVAVYESDDSGARMIVTAETPPARLTAQAAPTDSFTRFVRFPAAEKALLPMNAANPVAYYRDSLSGGQTLHSGGVDGDILLAQVTPPDGSPTQFVGFRYDGVRRCWVSRQGSNDCIGGGGVSSISIAWLAGTQCGKSGSWRFEAFRNALATLPTELNDYLTDHDGYTEGGAIFPDKVVAYANSRSAATKVSFVSGRGERGDVIGGIARDAVCKAGPSPLKVQHRRVPNGGLHGHFATAWGRPDAENTFLLKDPNGGLNNQLDSPSIPHDYGNVHLGTRSLKPAPTTFVFPGGLTIALGSPAELLLTDSSGRRTGLNPATGAEFEEIPGSSYMVDTIDPPDEPDGKGIDTKMLMVSPLPDGAYTLAVQGTGNGTYVLEFRYQGVDHVGEAKAAIRDVPIAQGTVHTYRFTAPVAPSGGFRLAGGFDGGGQRPRDVNKFLSYAALSRSRTDLPAGTTAYPLTIFYDAASVANTLSVTINGTNITSLFQPVPGGFETVSIPLQKGSNTLQLSIDGSLANRVATDTDRLTFRVP